MDKTKSLKGKVLEALIKEDSNGLTSEQIMELTGQETMKLARQLVRKARWSLIEMGYRLAKDNERLEGGYVVYRAIKIGKTKFQPRLIQKKFEVTLYNIRKVA